MKFTLHYSGPLRSNGRPDHKHELRRAFHVQLAELWKHEPLLGMKYLLLPEDSPERKLGQKLRTAQTRGAFTFAPLVASQVHLVASVDVTLLRPEPAGRLVSHGGDIDNRLKTLFDAMSIPQTDGLPLNVVPSADETPFYCVLEDDVLITSMSVHAEHLLKPGIDPHHVELIVRVETAVTQPTWGNAAFG